MQQFASVTKDPVELNTIMKSLKDVRSQLLDRSPMEAIVKGINEWKAANKELNILKQTEDVKKFIQAQKDLKEANNQINKDKAKGKDTTASTEKQLKAQKELDEAMKTGDVQSYLKAENDLAQANEDAAKGINGMQNGLQKFSSLANGITSVIKGIADGLGIAFNDDTERVIENIGKAFSIVSTALSVLAIAETLATAAGLELEAVLWPLLAVTAALTVAFTLFGAKNAKIDKQIKESENTVKKLQNAYKELLLSGFAFFPTSIMVTLSPHSTRWSKQTLT